MRFLFRSDWTLAASAVAYMKLHSFGQDLQDLQDYQDYFGPVYLHPVQPVDLVR